jgi:hypothetical protein
MLGNSPLELRQDAVPLLRFERQQDVIQAVEVAQVAGGVDVSRELAEVAGNAQTAAANRFEMRTASDDANLDTGTRQRRGNKPADRARAEYRYFQF